MARKLFMVAIDVGHAKGTGAKGNGLDEHEVCKDIGYLVSKFLEEGGYVDLAEVVDFESKSNSADLNDTIAFVNRTREPFDCVVSLHCDAGDNRAAKGAHVCYYPGSNRGLELAESIAKRLARLLPGRANRTVARSGLAILKRTRPVAVLCECGFLTNKEDAEFLKKHDDVVAYNIAEGIEEWIINSNKLSL